MTDTSDPIGDFDAQVKAADPDRWLSTRMIADPAARADIVVLYALNHALARVAETVSEPMMGHIRLAWWREAIEELAAGKPARAHPVVAALAEPLARGAFDPAALDALVEARAGDLEPEALADEARLYAHIDATAGALAAVAAHRLDPASPPDAVRAAMRAWGLAGLARNGRLPATWGEAGLAERVDSCLAAARLELKALPVKAFPAVAHAAFARPYARGRDPGLLEKQGRLLAATVLGRP